MIFFGSGADQMPGDRFFPDEESILTKRHHQHRHLHVPTWDNCIQGAFSRHSVIKSWGIKFRPPLRH